MHRHPGTGGSIARSAAIATAAILLAAFLFGGGGVRYGLANLAVQLTALLAIALHRDAFLSFWKSAPWPLRLLVLLSLLAPVLQAVPLPPSLWTSLPGHGLVAQSLAAAGHEGWMPTSVDPRRTLLAASALITPLGVLACGWKLPRHTLLSLGWLVVALGLATLILGSVQVATQGNFGVFYSERPETDLLLGTFANRNSTGLLLVGALAFAAVLPPPRPIPAQLAVRIGICSLLALAIVLTRSRSALVLTAVPLGLAFLRFAWWSMREAPGRPDQGGNRRPLFVVAGALGLAAAAIAALLVFAPGRVGTTLERFEEIEDNRLYIWEDGVYSASRYWPLGAGMGTFDEVFQVDESLENMTARRAGRAHNDYIEIAIEFGLPGLVLVCAWLALVVWLSWRARTSRLNWVAWAGAAFLVAIAGQSITDYPLRNQTLLAFAGFALLVLARLGDSSRETER